MNVLGNCHNCGEMRPCQCAAELPRLAVDEKWSIEYDPSNNDRPVRWLRYGERLSLTGTWGENNAVTSMFYALLAAKKTGDA